MNPAVRQSTSEDGTLGAVDHEIVALLDEYLAMIEQGKPVEMEAFLARRPELADELAAYVGSIDFMHRASRELTELDDSTSLFDWTGRSLGEYEIIRELGRGGMGVVYEAVQKQLGRRVALKILPTVAVLDRRKAARFLLEAQAAAQLTHPNIVPVYGVGFEGGVHYYSMQYIEGQSLESAIRHWKQAQTAAAATSLTADATDDVTGEPVANGQQIPTPNFCFSGYPSTQDSNYILEVAKLGIQAAEALQHAHDFGIVHRDIKPSNLILDRNSKLWVIDFGLASWQADSSITLSGAILGTVRYMSPEQATGHHGLVDYRTDIYSLGSTLYELLTLRAVYDADNTHQLLSQMEGRDPLALRRLNPSIPFDLETIVLKAISKHRDQRYATSQEFADDLRLFVAGKPIAARRPSLIDRTSKWASRHKNLVAAAAVIAVLALMGTSAAAILIAREQSATQAALATSQRNFERSQTYFRQSREVLDHFGMLVADRLSELPGTEQVRQEVLHDTLRYYDRFISQAAGDPEFQAELAVTCFKSGEFLDRLGAGDKAIESYERARQIFECLPGDAAEAQVAACHNNIALVLASQGKAEEAEVAFGAAIRKYEAEIAADDGRTNCRLQLASACGNLAVLLSNSGREDDARRFHQRALDLQRRLVSDHPKQTTFRRELAMTCNNLSNFHREGDLDRALELNGEAIDLLREVVADVPDNADYQSELALSLTNQGALLASRGDYRRAETAYRDAIEMYQTLLRRTPGVFAYRRDLAVAYNNLGRTLTQLQQFRPAITALEESRDVLQILSTAAPNNLVVLSSLGGVFNNLGLAYEHTEAYGQALAAYERAIAVQQSAISHAPKMAQFVDFLNRTRENYARALTAVGRSQDAAGVREEIDRQALP